MFIELEFELDVGRGGASADGLAAALIDRVGDHGGVSRGLIQPCFVQLGRKSQGRVAQAVCHGAVDRLMGFRHGGPAD